METRETLRSAVDAKTWWHVTYGKAFTLPEPRVLTRKERLLRALKRPWFIVRFRAEDAAANLRYKAVGTWRIWRGTAWWEG